MTITEPVDSGLAAPSEREIRAGAPDPVDRRRRRLFGGGTDGNEQLTAITGTLLLILLAALGITIVFIGRLLWWHLFLGVLLVGPVMLKIASTGYRFTRYYTGDAVYKRKGPPNPVMRALGPVVIGSTLGVLLTGLVLLVDGPSARQPWVLYHKVFFFLWLAAVGLHVLGHLVELPRALRAVEHSRQPRGAGALGRTLALGAALGLGAVLVLLFLPDFSAWTSFHDFHRFLPHH